MKRCIIIPWMWMLNKFHEQVRFEKPTEITDTALNTGVQNRVVLCNSTKIRTDRACR